MKTTMKIAAVTDDGKTISAHFGKAQFYEVITIEDGNIVSREQRPKAGHHTFSQREERHMHQGAEQHNEHTHQEKHRQMAETIKDCQIVLARGMGHGAYEGMIQHNIKPIVTDIALIDTAVQAVIKGTIVDHTEKLH